MVRKTTKCCRHGVSFGTVTYLQYYSEVYIKIHGSPCCKGELTQFIDILKSTIDNIGQNVPFYLIYHIENYKFNKQHMSLQRPLLSGANACAVITNSTIIRAAISLVTLSEQRSGKMRIFDRTSSGIQWIRSLRIP